MKLDKSGGIDRFPDMPKSRNNKRYNKLLVASDLVARARRIQADVLSQNLVHFGAVGVRQVLILNCWMPDLRPGKIPTWDL